MALKFVIDSYIPYIAGVLEPYGQVQYATPAQITPDVVADADALLIRTRTRVDSRLLAESRCRFVATATIGMDHYDMDWCRQARVTTVNAPGCNAPAVAQYVMACIARLINRPASQYTIAIVGVGHVGGIVERWARALDMRVLRVDPPRQRAEGGDDWYTLSDAARMADIITFHTPLTRTGADATLHLADRAFFESLKRTPILINTSRGPVVDNAAWADAIRQGRLAASAIDVWEGEPEISYDMLRLADFATPHIAGYSADGKIRAAQAVLDAVSAHFGLPQLHAAAPRHAVDVPPTVSLTGVAASYDPAGDTHTLRHALLDLDGNPRTVFEHLRDNYDYRPEVNGAKID